MRVLFSSLLLALCPLLPTPAARAEPILLADAGLRIGPYFSPSYDGGPIPMLFSIGFAEWTRQLVPSDAGLMLAATPDLIAATSAAIAHPAAEISMRLEGAAYATTLDDVLDGLWNQDFLFFHSYVPDFRSSVISDMTLTIDTFEVGGIGTNSLEAAFTVRIFSEPVPEPASWLLVLCCGLFHRRCRTP